MLRAARAQRRGQDDHHRNPRRPARGDGRRRRGARHALGPRRRGHQANASASRCKKPSCPRSCSCARRSRCSAASTAAASSPTRSSAGCRWRRKPRARVGKLSGGQKQRLAVACALVGDPELLFLDEPTTGLDPQSRRQLWELDPRLPHQGRTVLLTTHYMDEAERLCDRVAVVDHGKVIALGSPRELIAELGGEHVIEFTLCRQRPARPDQASLNGCRRAVACAAKRSTTACR